MPPSRAVSSAYPRWRSETSSSGATTICPTWNASWRDTIHSAGRAGSGGPTAAARPRFAPGWAGLATIDDALRLRDVRAGADEDGDGVQRHVDGDGALPLQHLRRVPVAPPPAPGKVHGATALSHLPHGCHQQVGPEQILIPQVAELPVLAVGEGHRSHDRHAGRPLGCGGDDVGLERDPQPRVAAIDVDHLGVVRRRRIHVPGSMRALAPDLHESRERAELDPAREHLAILELVVAARVRAPDGNAHEGGALLADDRAAQPEVGAPAAAEVLAPGDVAPPEGGPVLGAAVGRTREEHEVVTEHAGERVVMDLRLQRRIVVADLAAGAPVGPHVGYLRRDVRLAEVELDALAAVA